MRLRRGSKRAQGATTPTPEVDIPQENNDSSRLAGITDLRRHAAQGTIVNSAYQVMLSALGLLQRLIAAAFLTTADFGLWAIILTIVISLSFTTNLGVGDKYIQQSDPDQELAFQKAFTLQLCVALAFVVLAAIALPLFALAYDDNRIIAAGMVTALVIPLQALQTPALIAYRRLQYKRQRLLTGATPIITFIVTVGLAAAGGTYWSFVIGAVVGAAAGSLVCMITCPYRFRFRLDRATIQEYASFSWPLAATGVSSLISIQGSFLIASSTVGLTGVGAIGIVVGIISFTDRVDTIISQTLYPAVCAVVDRPKTLMEVFIKSNRAALMWAVPFGVGVALFSGDLITFLLGEEWRFAQTLLIITALSVGIGHVAFNWNLFMRALNWTRPLFVGAALRLVAFLGVAAVAMNAMGLNGYGVAYATSSAVLIMVRAFYTTKLFDGFSFPRQALRAILPSFPPALLILLLRQIAPGSRSLAHALAELAVYLLATVAFTLLLERRLLTEIVSYFRRRSTPRAAKVAAGAS